jgi:hypothetical protein
MAELIATETTDCCCAPDAQATCCEPDAKAECCDPGQGERCGCAAGLRDTHRVHAHAASAIGRARKPSQQAA